MVLEVLAAHPGHITAEKVLNAVQKRYPYVNKTTVYRTLELLTELGLASMTHMGGNQYEYELLESPHHHLICKVCGDVIELPELDAQPAPQADRAGARVPALSRPFCPVWGLPRLPAPYILNLEVVPCV